MTAIDDFFIRISFVILLTAGYPFIGVSQDKYPPKGVSRETVTLDIRIDLSRTYQTISNFAASDAWSCQFVGNWPEPAKDSIADWLFSMDTIAGGDPKGIGLSLWRFNIGAGSARQGEASGIKDEWRRTDLWQYQQGQQWFLKAAGQRGVRQFLGFFNSPPVQLTTNARAYADNGRCNVDSAHYSAFAQYSVDVLKGIKHTTGIALDYISPVNEPQWDWSDGGQEGSPYTNREISGLVKAFSAALLDHRLTTRILVPESGEHKYLWEEGNKPGRGNQVTAFFNSSSPSYIGNLPNVCKTVASHSYFTTSPFSRAIEIRKKIAHDIASAGNLDYWQSEYCILGDNAGEINGGSRDLGINAALYMAGVIHADLVYGNAAAWQWWLAISPYNYKDGLIYIDKNKTGGSYHDSKMLWALGNYSRFIRPGMKRVYATLPSSDSILVSAWKDEKKKKLVVVVVNRSLEYLPLTLSTSTGNAITSQWSAYTTSSTKNLGKQTLSSNQAEIPPQSLITFETSYK